MRSIWTSLSAAVTRHPGRVVVAVGATVAALAVVVALDVLFALASTLILLPPLLVWADEHRWLRDLPPGDEWPRRIEERGPAPVGGS